MPRPKMTLSAALLGALLSCVAAQAPSSASRISTIKFGMWEQCLWTAAAASCNSAAEPAVRALAAKFVPNGASCGGKRCTKTFCMLKGATQACVSFDFRAYPPTTACAAALGLCRAKAPVPVPSAAQIATNTALDKFDQCLVTNLPRCTAEPLMTTAAAVFVPSRLECGTRKLYCNLPLSFCASYVVNNARTTSCVKYTKPLTDNCKKIIFAACGSPPSLYIQDPNAIAFKLAPTTPVKPPTVPVQPKPVVPPVVPVQPKPPVIPVVKPVVPTKPVVSGASSNIVPLFPDNTATSIAKTLPKPLIPMPKLPKLSSCWNAMRTKNVTCKGECRPVQNSATLQYDWLCTCNYDQMGDDCALKRAVSYPPQTQTWSNSFVDRALDPSKNTTALRHGDALLGVYFTQSLMECMTYCQSFNDQRYITYQQTCGAVSFVYGGSGGSMPASSAVAFGGAGMCSLYRYKPVGSCASWVVPATGTVSAYITPVMPQPNTYGLCH